MALVTGGAEGIGFGIAERLAAEGAEVIIADIQDGKGKKAARRIGASYVHCDVSQEEDWSAALTPLRRLDILVNNAGVNPAGQDLATLTLSAWRNIHAVNLDGVFLGCRAAIRKMEGEGGAIVNVASAGALHPHIDYPAYSSSKSAVCTLTKSVALYCGRRGLSIRCNAVLPGAVETPMIERLRAGRDPDAAREATLAAYPIGFLGQPADIGSVVAFLASDDARFMTGSLVAVDGGFLI